MKKIATILLAVFALLAGLQVGVYLSSSDKVVVDESSHRALAAGEVVGMATEYNTHAWLGLPYARAPLSNLRWKAARPIEPWEGVKVSTSQPEHCMQVGSLAVTNSFWKWGKPVGSEDCLYLNLWSPRFELGFVPRGEDRLPVMLWIHGGGNTSGAASRFDMAQLAGTQKIVALAINYRLGMLGWFTHPALLSTAETPADASGNFAVTDMIQSLMWVQENIEYFGGDPNNVTIFGESAGGLNVAALLASPMAQGLFHRAIIQSGSVATFGVPEAENFVDDEMPGVKNSSSEILIRLLVADKQAQNRSSAKALIADMSDDEILRYFYSQSFEELLGAYEVSEMGTYDSPKMYRDGVVLPAIDIVEWLQEPANHSAIPTITGYNKDEQKLFLAFDERMVKSTLKIIKEVVDKDSYERQNRYRSDDWAASSVVQVADALHQSGTPVWAYRFDWDEGADTWRGNTAEVYGAAHGFEIPFLFGDWEGFELLGVATEMNASGRMLLADQMVSYWAEFAYNGNPGRGRNDGMVKWQSWQGDSARESGGQLMVFDSAADGGVRMERNFLNFYELKERLKEDSSFQSNRERCMLYTQMFFYTDEFITTEYADLGCAQFNPEQFGAYVW